MYCVIGFVRRKRVGTHVISSQHIKAGFRNQSSSVWKAAAMKTIIFFLFSSGLVSAATNRTIHGQPRMEDCGKITDNPYEFRFSQNKGLFNSWHALVYEKCWQDCWRSRGTLTHPMASVQRIWVRWNYLGFKHYIVCCTLSIFHWWNNQSWIS